MIVELSILEDSPNRIRISLTGDLNARVASQIEDKFVTLLVGRGQHAIVDISGVSFMDSLGLGMLVTAHNILKQNGAKLVILKPQEFVAEMLEISKLTDMLNVVMSESDAMAKLSESI